jgi:hypothetical protein
MRRGRVPITRRWPFRINQWGHTLAINTVPRFPLGAPHDDKPRKALSANDQPHPLPDFTNCCGLPPWRGPRLKPQFVGVPSQINTTFSLGLVDVAVDKELENVIVTSLAVGVEACFDDLKATINISLEDRYTLGGSIAFEDFETISVLQHGEHLDEKLVPAFVLKQLQPYRIFGRPYRRHAFPFDLTESRGKDKEVKYRGKRGVRRIPGETGDQLFLIGWTLYALLRHLS